MKTEKIIYEWVKKNFGESEANDPSWSIKDLAKEIDEHRWEMCREAELENVMEDVKYVADMNDIELSEQGVGAVAQKYINSESYGALDAESILYFINRYKEERC